MKVRVFRSGNGDALLLTGDTGKHILIDGGVPDAYEAHFATTLGKLRDKGEALELVCVSHIDRDHIGGILKMMDNEVAWRLYEARRANPALRRRARNKRPRFKRPPEVKAIWHNGFWEKIRARKLNRRDVGSSIDVADIMYRQSMIYAGAGETRILKDAQGDPSTAQSLATQMRFLGQSVGDAIELSRRVGSAQLQISLNPEFGGKFITRKRGQDSFSVGNFDLTVLGPTTAELNELLTEWNDWLEGKESYLKGLLKKHDRDAGDLANTDLSEIISNAINTAIEFASNQSVTPPNLASIIILAENDGKSILLTGDADDPSIIKGLKDQGRLDSNNQILIDIFKVPHHGAHNSYSDTLARTVLAHDYLFCGNGKHENPERDVINGYLKVLLEGDTSNPPALRSGVKPTFWFNAGPDLAETITLRHHWQMLEQLMTAWQDEHPNKFRYKFMKRGDSFVVQ